MTAELVSVDAYNSLTDSERARLLRLTREVHTGSRIASRAMLQIGARLEEIKRILKADGLWRFWCASEFGNSHDTADRYIRAANRFARSIDAASAIPKSVLYYLTDEAPPEAAEVALERAKKGEQITRQVAEQIASTFQRAAVNVIQESIATQGTVTLNGKPVTVLSEVGTFLDADGKPFQIGKLNGQVIGVALTQEVAELLKKDNQSVQDHIVRRGQTRGKVTFLNWGSLSEFTALMKSGQTQAFKGEIRISVWGVPEAPKDETK